jgi:hypothetical protein
LGSTQLDPYDRLVADYEFWAETCVQIRDKLGRVRPFTLNRAQRRVGQIERQQLKERGRARIFVLKARQGGISTDQQIRNLHQIWSQPNFDVMTFAHTDADTQKFFAITTRAIDHFPPEFLPPLGDKATREVSFPEMDAIFYTGTAGAKRSGRSLTLKRFHGSEFALWDKPRATLNRVTPAVVPQGSVITLETTASGYDSEAHNFWREAQQGANDYAPVFIPWWECDVDNYRLPLMEPDELGALEPDEADLVARFGLDLEQIKWRRSERRNMGPEFATEYAEDEETCWAAPGGMFYDVELLKYLQARVPTPIATEWGGALEVYGEPIPGERAVGGCDTAEGYTVGEPSKKDRSAFTIRAFPSRRLLVKFEDRSVQPEDLAGFLNTWGRKYGGVYWAIEKNAHGITTLRQLRDHYRYPVQGIYHRRQQDAVSKESASDLIGWHTNEQTKALLLDYGRALLLAARDGMATVPSASALRDAFAVRRDDKGKVSLNGKDVLVSEMLCEVAHQSVPPPQKWWLGPMAPPERTPLTKWVGGKA